MADGGTRGNQCWLSCVPATLRGRRLALPSRVNGSLFVYIHQHTVSHRHLLPLHLRRLSRHRRAPLRAPRHLIHRRILSHDTAESPASSESASAIAPTPPPPVRHIALCRWKAASASFGRGGAATAA
jgi:hypothetical protein